MRKIFVLAVIIGFLWTLPAVAWQDPCSVVDNVYIYEGFYLTDWQEANVQFSPAPECSGIVTLGIPGENGYYLNYAGNNGVMTIGGVSCRVNNDGNLECDVVTVPEESTTLIFDQQ